MDATEKRFKLWLRFLEQLQELVGPNPTDWARIDSKYHIAIDGDGMPVACLATAANVPGTLLFERLFLAALGVMARIHRVLKLHFFALGRIFDDTS